MHVLISADMEGATGTVLPADVTAGMAEYERCRRLMLGDVNAAIDGFMAAGATRITVNDAHCHMTNLLLEELRPPAELAIGRHKSLAMMELIDSGVDAVAMLGYHTGAGQDGVLAHTCLSRSLLGVRIDGKPVDEGAFNALVAHEAGVPVVLVTGDDRLCSGSRGWAPRARRVVVKTALSRHSAICRTPAVTTADIRAAAADALELAGAYQPTTAAHTVEVDVDYPILAERAGAIPGVEAIGGTTVRFEASSAAEALRIFRIVVTVVDSGREAEWA